METKKGKSKVFANAAQVVTTGTSVVSITTAKLKFSFDKGFTKMMYKVFVTNNGLGITKIHLHCGTAGTNGGVAAQMWEYDTMKKGNLVSQDVQDIECEGKPINTIASLYQAMRNGSIYMSIAAVRGNGYLEEVARGQIFL